MNYKRLDIGDAVRLFGANWKQYGERFRRDVTKKDVVLVEHSLSEDAWHDNNVTSNGFRSVPFSNGYEGLYLFLSGDRMAEALDRVLTLELVQGEEQDVRSRRVKNHKQICYEVSMCEALGLPVFAVAEQSEEALEDALDRLTSYYKRMDVTIWPE